MSRTAPRFSALAIMLGAVTLSTLGEARGADDAVARCLSPTGTLIRRANAQEQWQVVREGDGLPTGELMVGLPGAVIESTNGAVRLSFGSDFSGTSPFPIIETALILNVAKGVDLNFTMDRGRVELANRKSSGAARVRCHVGHGEGELTLSEPGSRVALELYGRWPAGVPFSRNPKPGEGPTLDLVVLVLEGQVELDVNGRDFAMKAPPGPALLQCNSVTGWDPTPHRLDKLPAWAQDDPSSPQAQKRKAVLEAFRQEVATKPPDTVLAEFLKSDDPLKRRLAVFGLAALDDLPHLGDALAHAQHEDVWENGVLALRHWIGRGPGQDQKLYQGLIKKAGYSAVDAEAVLELLHSFGEEALARPETYEILIAYLDHDKLALRGLAHWHLVRLVPEGRKIEYHPLDPKEKRERAVEEWKKLVPAGNLPPGRSSK
jgi:hypothetical protein